MADSGFDPCECVWSHEMAMRRLLSLLRQSQSHCTDSECFTDEPGLPAQNGLGNDMLLMTMVWAALAMLLFFLRPSSLRGSSDTKPSNNRPQGGGAPPAPPTSS